MGYIVTVADVAELQSFKLFLFLLDGHKIRHCLARMRVVSEAVDHRNRRILCHVDHDLMGERSNHNSLNHSLEVLCNIIDRLALSKTDFCRRQIEREAAKLLDADVKRCARA